MRAASFRQTENECTTKICRTEKAQQAPQPLRSRSGCLIAAGRRSGVAAGALAQLEAQTAKPLPVIGPALSVDCGCSDSGIVRFGQLASHQWYLFGFSFEIELSLAPIAGTRVLALAVGPSRNKTVGSRASARWLCRIALKGAVQKRLRQEA
jgi:hypothetical protein